MENLLKNSKTVVSQGAWAGTSASTATTTNTGVVIDLTGYEGVHIEALFSCMAAAAIVNLIHQEAATTVSSDFQTKKTQTLSTDEHGALANSVLLLDVVKPQQRYARHQVVNHSGNAVGAGVLVKLYANRKGPTTQSTAYVIKSEVAVSPTT